MNVEPELTDDELVLYHYGEAEDAEGIRVRLAASPAARERYEALVRVLKATDEWQVPELPAGFEAELWERLRPRLVDARAEDGRGQAPPLHESVAEPPRGALVAAAHRFGGARLPRWAPAAAAAVLLLAVGYLAGRLSPPALPGPAVPRPLSAEARQRILVETLADHLERSQRLFAELVNAPPEGSGALGGERQAARELLSENRLYRTAAQRGGRDGVAALLDEMEPVLLELAHLPADPAETDLAFLRQRIEARALLFKTRVAAGLLTRSLQPGAASPTRSNA
ncbi:MAG TPA: hypothetical protein VGV61_14225 [Thermoanaerobaculia bacterium]|jgi:hypothetical protein|nr:hypothetical protein [Thermoanaerobaculia bacterium]